MNLIVLTGIYYLKIKTCAWEGQKYYLLLLYLGEHINLLLCEPNYYRFLYKCFLVNQRPMLLFCNKYNVLKNKRYGLPNGLLLFNSFEFIFF